MRAGGSHRAAGYGSMSAPFDESVEGAVERVVVGTGPATEEEAGDGVEGDDLEEGGWGGCDGAAGGGEEGAG